MKRRIDQIKKIINDNRVAIGVLFSALFVHFWLIIIHPGSVLYGGPGDHTASLIWLYEQSPQTPWWGHTLMSAFPGGENLWSPTYVLGQIQYILFWLCSAPFGSGVVGYNLLTAIGFIISFISFYSVTRALWKTNKVITASMAYIIAFTPFVLALNSVGHLSYIFAPGFVMGVVWLFWMIFEDSKKKLHWKKPAIILGLTIGLSWLFDPYFLLFSAISCVGLWIGWMAVGRYKELTTKGIFKRVGLIALVIAISAAPLGVYSFVQKQEIDDTTSFRASIEGDAQQYSANVEDYFLPSANNPVIPDSLSDLKTNSLHGAASAPLYVSLWLMICAAVLFVWQIRTRQRRNRRVIYMCLIAAGVLFLFSLPPRIHIGGFELISPTYLIIQITSAWRVFSRIYIFMFPFLGIVSLLLLQNAWKQGGRYIKIVAILALCIVPLDMLLRNPFNPDLFWDVNRSIPSTYAADQVSKKDVLAEYPLREAPHYKGSLYFSAQLSHDAAIFNPMMPDATHTYEQIRRALVDLDNPQTIGALKFLGVDKIQVWMTEGQEIDAPEGLKLIAEDHYKGLFGAQTVRMYEIQPNVKPVRYIAQLKDASRIWTDEVVKIHEPVSSKATLNVIDLCKSYTSLASCCKTNHSASRQARMQISFLVGNESGTTARISNLSGLGRQETTIPADTERVFTIPGDKSVELQTTTPVFVSNYNVRVFGDECIIE